jgi:peptidoglycan/LPS O-acetylase OafA/YrhL
MPNTTGFKESGWTALIEHLFLLQAIGPTGNALTFNSAAWSISVEFYTYLVFGLTVLLAGRLRNALFVGFVCITVTLLVTRHTFGSTDLVRCIAGFFTGCLTALAAKRLTLRLPPWVALGAFVALPVFLAWETDPRWNSLTYVLTAVLILSLATSEGGALTWLLKRRLLTWLGTISYSIYMSHTAVIWVFNQVFRVVFKRPVLFLDDRMTPQLPLAATLLAYVLVVACVLLLSQLTYRFVEDPLRRKSRSLDFPRHFANRR